MSTRIVNASEFHNIKRVASVFVTHICYCSDQLHEHAKPFNDVKASNDDRFSITQLIQRYS